jgi:hypothetical protein
MRARTPTASTAALSFSQILRPLPVCEAEMIVSAGAAVAAGCAVAPGAAAPGNGLASAALPAGVAAATPAK